MAKITVDTTNRALNHSSKLNKEAVGDLIISNKDTTLNVYVELWATASSTTSWYIEPGGDLVLANIGYDKVNVISTGSNANVFVLERQVN